MPGFFQSSFIIASYRIGIVRHFITYFKTITNQFWLTLNADKSEVFSPARLVLSVPVQVIASKDSSPKWPIVFRAGHKTTQSLTHSLR